MSQSAQGLPCLLADFMMRALWICGMTPPPAMVALIKVSSSSSPLMANWRCLGVILFTLRSLDAFPASSKTSAVKYSRMAALYTAEVAPTLELAATLPLKNLWILPTGNWSPALAALDCGALLDLPAPYFPPFPPLPPLPVFPGYIIWELTTNLVSLVLTMWLKNKFGLK